MKLMGGEAIKLIQGAMKFRGGGGYGIDGGRAEKLMGGYEINTGCL